MRVEGHCHCGAIAFEAEVVPGTVAVCHCADCQMQSGSAFRCNIPAAADGFCLIKGQPRTYLKIANSGSKRIHAFCENCGGPIYACAADNPQTYSLRVGTLQQRYELDAPVRQIWTSRKQPWVTFTEAIQSFEAQP